MNYGLGYRHTRINVATQAGRGLFNFGLWVTVIVCDVIATVWSFVAAGFAVLNAATKPIETVAGPLGLYLWNGLAVLFSMVTLILYVILFLSEMQYNIIPPEDKARFTSDGYSQLSYSFYCVLFASLLFSANILVVFVLGTRCTVVKRQAEDFNEHAADAGVMMY